MRRSLFDADHEAFRESFRAFLDKEVVPHHDAWDAAGIVPRELFTTAGRSGFLGMDIPEEHGGGGVSDFRFNTVIADVGRQSPEKDDLVTLEAPKADMTLSSGAWVALHAMTGLYRGQTRRLDLFGDRPEFFGYELVIHRRTLVNRDSSMHRPLSGCNKNDGYEGDAAEFGGSHFYGQTFRRSTV